MFLLYCEFCEAKVYKSMRGLEVMMFHHVKLLLYSCIVSYCEARLEVMFHNIKIPLCFCCIVSSVRPRFTRVRGGLRVMMFHHVKLLLYSCTTTAM